MSVAWVSNKRSCHQSQIPYPAVNNIVIGTSPLSVHSVFDYILANNV